MHPADRGDIATHCSAWTASPPVAASNNLVGRLSLLWHLNSRLPEAEREWHALEFMEIGPYQVPAWTNRMHDIVDSRLCFDAQPRHLLLVYLNSAHSTSWLRSIVIIT